MSFSINTNVASLQSQNYLRINSDFQSKTINRVTSGLRIIQSGDDAAGLAIANGLRSDQAVLTQGVRNANDGMSQLQIIDGGINNISQLLDRARTLATQSATGTFTGDRGVLNSEFQSVLGEIDRQAQAVGLDTGGIFAKSLSVFIGGGKTSGNINAIENGSVTVDLSGSTVDSRSLGLKGVQAVGNIAVDLGSVGATAPNVANILADPTNQASAPAGFTNFYFSGPGFSDAGKIKVAVNLSGVTDTNTLVTAINAAIKGAGSSGASAAATAFGNAGISATIVKDSGGQHLAFASSTNAFQVSAGDRTANALLGNITGTTTGTALTTTVAGTANVTLASTAVAGESIKVRVQGAGLTAPQDLSLAVNKGDTVQSVINSLSTAITGDTALQGAGITLNTAVNATPLSFTSTSGQKFTVEASGDTQNLLGLGSFTQGASNAVDYTTIDAAALTGNTNGTATLEFSINGAASNTNQVTVNLNGGNATAASITATDGNAAVDTTGKSTLDVAIDGTVYNVTGWALGAGTTKTAIAAAITTSLSGAGSSATVSVDNTNHLIITSGTKGGNSSVQILTSAAGTDAGALFGFTAGPAVTGTARTGSDLINDLNQTFSTNPTLAAADLTASFDGTKVTVASGNGTNFQLNALANGAAAKAGVSTGTDSATVNTTVNNKLYIAVDGAAAQVVTLTSGAARTVAQVQADITAAAIPGLTATSANGHLVLSSAAGSGHSVQVITGSNDASAALGLTLNTVYSGKDTNIGYGDSGASFTGNTASAAPATSPDAITGGADQTAALTFAGVAYGSDKQTVTISAIDSNGLTQQIDVTLRNDGSVRNARNADEAVNTINQALQSSNKTVLQNIVAVKTDVGGVEKIVFASAGEAFKVDVGTNANGTGFAATGTTSAGVVGSGSTADISNQGSAQTAVTALSNAVATLGSAQAVVGRGENQFNYATNLAQSQLTNLATAESRIRDADLAAEAANLTKAQILVQAGVAALAQANSAPQQVLTLLRG
jgi:flagellin